MVSLHAVRAAIAASTAFEASRVGHAQSKQLWHHACPEKKTPGWRYAMNTL